MTDKIGLLWLKNIFKLPSKYYIAGTKYLLILNSYSSYLTAEFNKFCKKNIIIYLYISAHALYIFNYLI